MMRGFLDEEIRFRLATGRRIFSLSEPVFGVMS